MIEPESVSMAICKGNSPDDITALVRRVGERVFINTRIGGKAYLSLREAEHFRRGLSRAIREIRELTETSE